MTVVYVDTLFVLNSMVDYLLLLAGARLAGEPLHRIRFGAAAALGGLYAVALFLPGLMFLERWPCRIASAVLMLLVAYGGGRRLLRQSLIFFALVCAFGGGCCYGFVQPRNLRPRLRRFRKNGIQNAEGKAC